MNIWKLSLRSIWRRKGKMTLLAMVVFVIAVFIYAGWSLKSASVQTQDKSRQAIGASFRLEENEANRHIRLEEQAAKVGEGKEGTAGGYHQKQLPSGDWMTWVDHSFETLLLDDIEKIASVDGVEDYNIVTANTLVNPVGFERIEDKDLGQNGDPLGVSLRGERDMKLDFDVQKNNLTIIDGRGIAPDDKDKCVVSKEIAEMNHLGVGSVLSFNNWKERETSEIYKAEIVGIYESPNGIAPIMAGDSYRSENIIYTDLGFPEKAEGEKGNPLYQYAVFTVDDIDNYEKTKERIKSLDIGWDRYDLLDNTGISNVVAENYSSLQNMSTWILLLSIGSGGLIICLIFLFWIKGRVKEIGIFLSLGRTKADILAQMLLEGLLVGCISFCLATSVSGFVSNGVADYLVDYQVSEQMEQKQAESGMVANSYGEDNELEITGINVDIGMNTVAISGLGVLGIITMSVAISGIKVLLQKPKDILTKMS